MALMTRITHLFKADMHAIIDSIEEPSSVLKQAIREMEDLIVEDETQLITMAEHHKQVLSSNIETENLLNQDEEELDLCLETDNEELARVIIKRKLERLQFKKNLDEKGIRLTKAIEELNKKISQNRVSHESMKQKADLLVERTELSDNKKSNTYPDFNISQDDVEVALLREKKKRRLS